MDLRSIKNLFRLIIFSLCILKLNCNHIDEDVYSISEYLIKYKDDFFTICESENCKKNNCTFCESQCFEDIKFWMRSFPKEIWAVSLLDSCGKFPSGILSGNRHNFGEYDQCLKTFHTFVPDNGTEKRIIFGKYCLTNTSFVINSTDSQVENIQKNLLKRVGVTLPVGTSVLEIGVCLPNTCGEEVLNNMFQIISNFTVDIKVYKDKCSTFEPKEWTATEWVGVAFFATFGAILCFSTLYDVFIDSETSYRDLLVCFSLLTNTKRLLKLDTRSSGSIKCLHGIRSLSILWIIFAHRYLVAFAFPVRNRIDILEFSRTYKSTLVISAPIAVDTFLFLSGFLVCYIYFKHRENETPFNFISFYLHRCLRIMPPLIAVIVAQACLYEHSGRGPVWQPLTNTLVQGCQNHWWATLLFIQNYIHQKEMCIGHAWYLSVDMQLYVLSPILLFPLYKYKKFGLINYAVWTSAAFIALATIVYSNKWPATTFFTESSKVDGYLMGYYYPTHTRAMPWLIGIGFGFLLHRSKGKEINMKKISIAVSWIVSLSILMAMVFGMKDMQQIGHVINHAQDSTYNVFGRSAWVLAIGWIVFACVHGFGGPVNWLLSLGIWEIIGRLSYSLYLVHLLVQFWFTSNMNEVPHFSNTFLIYAFFGDFGYTLILAYFLNMTFESPIPVVEKYMFSFYRTKILGCPAAVARRKQRDSLKMESVNLSTKND